MQKTKKFLFFLSIIIILPSRIHSIPSTFQTACSCLEKVTVPAIKAMGGKAQSHHCPGAETHTHNTCVGLVGFLLLHGVCHYSIPEHRDSHLSWMPTQDLGSSVVISFYKDHNSLQVSVVVESGPSPPVTSLKFLHCVLLLKEIQGDKIG